jgi:hypothetical protein
MYSSPVIQSVLDETSMIEEEGKGFEKVEVSNTNGGEEERL